MRAAAPSTPPSLLFDGSLRVARPVRGHAFSRTQTAPSLWGRVGGWMEEAVPGRAPFFFVHNPDSPVHLTCGNWRRRCSYLSACSPNVDSCIPRVPTSTLLPLSHLLPTCVSLLLLVLIERTSTHTHTHTLCGAPRYTPTVHPRTCPSSRATRSSPSPLF